jgi:diguanylate cyclase (GGDEF)-like protein
MPIAQLDLIAENEQLKQQIRTLKRLAYFDRLTNIPNRQLFDLRMADEWNRVKRSQSQICLLLIDIDFFKSYNDAYGHQAGDELLQCLGRSLLKIPMRSFDLVARYGGEEFAVILPDSTIQGAERVARSIAKVARLCKVSAAGDRVVTVSVGVAAIMPSDSNSPSTLFEQADKALYLAKNQGRDRVVVSQ